MGMRMGYGKRMGMFGGITDPQQIAGLKSQIGIRADQEALWNAYVKAVQDAAATRQADRQTMGPQAMQAMSPDDRRAFMLARQDSRRASFRTVSEAMSALMASLDDGQKYRARGFFPAWPVRDGWDAA